MAGAARLPAIPLLVLARVCVGFRHRRVKPYGSDDLCLDAGAARQLYSGAAIGQRCRLANRDHRGQYIIGCCNNTYFDIYAELNLRDIFVFASRRSRYWGVPLLR